jgi:glycosyltransferase involved in cell wall biosynthesis
VRIGIVSFGDPRSPSTWSGIPANLLHHLEQRGHEVVVAPQPGLAYHVARLACRARRWRDPRHVRIPLFDGRSISAWGRRVSRALRRTPVDAVLALSVAAHVGGALDVDAPIAFWHDATFAGLRSLYAVYHVSEADAARADAQMRAALEASSVAMFTSEWAVASAVGDYGADRERLRVVPFGAARTDPMDGVDFDQVVAGRVARPETRLLFAGVDWRRKGGDTAVAVVRALGERGLPSSLTVIGCRPDLGREGAEGVRVRGFLRKGGAQWRSDWLASDFLLLPTRADCTPVVFSEAASFGVPVLTTAVGGTSSVVRDGVTGFLFAPGAPPGEIADRILRSKRDGAAYALLARSARREYEQRLNWPRATAAIVDLLAEAVRRRGPRTR